MLLSMEPRLTQIGTPIYSVSCDREFQTAFIKFLSKNADEQRTEHPQAAVVEAVRRVIDKKEKEGRMPVSVRFVPKNKLSVLDVATEATTVAHDWGILDEGAVFTPKRVGGLLRTLGFDPGKKRTGYQFDVPAEKLADLVEKYQATLTSSKTP